MDAVVFVSTSTNTHRMVVFSQYLNKYISYGGFYSQYLNKYTSYGGF
jgi:hypothetical protein